jgi:hypothetical protein
MLVDVETAAALMSVRGGRFAFRLMAPRGRVTLRIETGGAVVVLRKI